MKNIINKKIIFKRSKKIKNKKTLVFFLITCIFILGAGVYFIIYNLTKNENNYKYTLDVYKTENNRLCKESDESRCNIVAFTIKTETKDAKILDIEWYVENFILYNDNGLKLYNVETKSIQDIDLDNNYQEYRIYASKDGTSLIGITFKDGEYTQYYNVSKNKIMYKNKYSSIFQKDDNFLEANSYTESTIKNKIYLLNANEEKIELSSEEVEISHFYDIYEFNNKYYFLEMSGTGGMSFGVHKIYSNDKKEIYSSNILSDFDISYIDSYMYLIDKDKILKFDIDGNLLLTSDTYSNIKGLIQNYVIYVDKNNDLVMQNVDTRSIIKITKWNDEWKYDWFASGYYDKEYFDSQNKDKKSGIYIFIKQGEGTGIEYYLKDDFQIVETKIKDYNSYMKP